MVTGSVNQTNTTTNMGSSNTPIAAAGLTPSAAANGVDLPPNTGAVRRGSENRRSNKPIMEKRRRARINNCLNELKTLILDAMKKDPARHSKLEKADILEMTVKHLESLQRQQSAMTVATDPSVLNKYRAGFSECASEVGRYLGRGESPQLDPHLKRRLLAHLSNCLNSVNVSNAGSPPPQLSSSPSPPATEHHPIATPVQVQLPPGITVSADGRLQATHNVLGSVQLVPTCLPNGDIALVLPSHQSHMFRSAAAPMSPSPSCASSASSAASSSPPPPPLAPFSRQHHHPPTSSPSPPIGFNLSMRSSGSVSPTSSTSSHDMVRPLSPPMQKPLSLVTRRSSEDESKSCWRPWSMV